MGVQPDRTLSFGEQICRAHLARVIVVPQVQLETLVGSGDSCESGDHRAGGRRSDQV